MDDRELSARLSNIEESLKEIKQFIIEEIQEQGEEEQETTEEQEEETETEQEEKKDIFEKNIIQPKIRPKKKANTE